MLLIFLNCWFVKYSIDPRFMCVLPDLGLSRHHTLLWGAVAAIQQVCLLACPKTVKLAPLLGEVGFNTTYTTVCQTAVIAPPRVGCVVEYGPV